MTDQLWTPQMVAGLTGLGGVIVGALITWLGLGKRIDADERLATRKFEFDKELAQRKFDLDRSQLIHKRRFELAETLLADAYRFSDLMGSVRTGWSMEGEGKSRPEDVGEPESLKRLKDSYFAPIERLQQHSEFINGFRAKRHTARAYFGSNAVQAFQFFDQSIVSVQTASETLIETAGERDNDPTVLKELRQDIWASHSEARKQADKVGKKIEEGVLLIENLCRPVLEWNGA